MDSPLHTHEHPLTLVVGRSQCKLCNLETKSDRYYHCLVCKDVSFHKECITFSSEITHPYHPRHALQICFHKFGEDARNCFLCNGDMGIAFYRCSICDLNIHLFCASQQQLVLTLDPGKKNHDHPLSIFPRKISFTCNLCGCFGEFFLIYACFQCNFLVHKGCLDLPNVIRISCHKHRISRRLHLPPKNELCGVCYLKVDTKYGAYFCNRDCVYAVAFHALCATSKKVWDGREHENVPEEEDELKDVEPYEVIDDNHIKHFSHEHHLRVLVLNEDSYKKTSRCQACNLLIFFDNIFFYSCDLCDFNLHLVCAESPRTRWHSHHRHPLTLKADNDKISSYGHSSRKGFFFCSLCTRFSSGFKYICGKEMDYFETDVRCASMPQRIFHKNHQHRLYVNLINPNTSTCASCRKATTFVFYCLRCPEYTLCFECVTIPEKVVYKHDKHLLTLSYGEKEQGQCWCEICETTLDPKKWFYKCDDCCVTIHIPCLLGRSPYAKPGRIMIKARRLDEEEEMPIGPEEEFDIVSNETFSRPLCRHCDRRCPDSVVFKQEQDFYCSLDCLRTRKLYNDSDIFPIMSYN